MWDCVMSQYFISVYYFVAAHGKCLSTTTTVQVLVRDPHRCVLALQNGETVVVNEWRATSVQVRVGCECGLSQSSHFPLTNPATCPLSSASNTGALAEVCSVLVSAH